MEKLESAGLGGKVLRLLNNYLKNRQQVTKIGNYISANKPIQYGLVQGSALSPGFYNVYAKDMQYLKTECHLSQFADDLAILSIDSNLENAISNLQKDVILIQKWFFNHEIFMNYDKTKFMIIKSPHKTFKISCIPKLKCHIRDCLFSKKYEVGCDCTEVDYTEQEKYVGMVIDHNFKFNKHIEQLSKKLGVVSYSLKHIRYCVPKKILYMIYKSLFESLLRYGLSCYGFATKTTLKPLINVQNNVVKQCFSSNSFANDILAVENLHKQILLLKYFTNPDYRKHIVNPYNMRKNKFFVPKINTKYGCRLPEFFVPRMLNSIDNKSILDITCLNLLKDVLKTHISEISY